MAQLESRSPSPSPLPAWCSRLGSALGEANRDSSAAAPGRGLRASSVVGAECAGEGEHGCAPAIPDTRGKSEFGELEIRSSYAGQPSGYLQRSKFRCPMLTALGVFLTSVSWTQNSGI